MSIPNFQCEIISTDNISTITSKTTRNYDDTRGWVYQASDIDATISEKNDLEETSSGSSSTFADTSQSADLLVSPNFMDPLDEEYIMILQC